MKNIMVSKINWTKRPRVILLHFTEKLKPVLRGGGGGGENVLD